MTPTTAILMAFALVALNAFFVATEFAIVKVRETRLRELARKGNRAARDAEQVVRRLDVYLSASQVGVTLASLGLGWVGEPAFAHLFEPLFARLPVIQEAVAHTAGLTVAFLLITVLHITLGEQAPKSLAIQRPERTTLFVARPIRWFTRIFYPVIWTLNALANATVRMLRLGPATDAESFHSEEELQMLLSRPVPGGHSPLLRQRLIQNVFTFGRRSARQIMIPRTDVVFLSTRRPVAELLDQIRQTGHTRYPVCDGDLDRVLGTAHIKDLQRLDPARPDLAGIARPALFVPESMSAERLLLTFQESHQHLAVVVDEYGGASGIVTLEDVIEELVGELQDEFDEETPDFLPLRRGGFLVSAGMLLEAVTARLGVTIEEDVEADTLGGYVQQRLGRLGRVGDEIVLGGYTVRVVQARGRRLLKLLVLPRGGPGAAA